MTEQEVAKLNRKVPELMGAIEAARVLGTKRNNLNKIARLPEPCQYLERGAVWRADVIREFAEAREKARKELEDARAAKAAA